LLRLNPSLLKKENKISFKKREQNFGSTFEKVDFQRLSGAKWRV